MSKETRDFFRKTIRKAIDTELQINTIRSRMLLNLEKIGDVNFRQLFDQLDWLNRGYINKQDIKRAVDQFVNYVSTVTAQQWSHPDSLEMEALIRRFNKDKQNGRISLPEFLDELTPGQ